MSNAIELKNITKRFPSVIANDNISFTVKKGEIHALAGENGAGKSTLMNILYGLYRPDEGKILIWEKPVKFQSSKDSIACKIGMVHQHFMLVPKLTVTENIIVGNELIKGLKVDRDTAAKKIKEISDKYGLSVDPYQKVSELSVTQQQRVEILKILYREAEILIFDEPTAVLTPQEIDEFCNILLNLKAQGKTIIFISHKLAEVMKVSDKITVIRRGKVVDTVKKEDATVEELTFMMVGRDVDLSRIDRKPWKSPEKLFELIDINYKDEISNVEKLKNINLSLNRGEILGIAGVDGNGQEELVQLIFGKTNPNSGEIIYRSKSILNHSIRERKNDGISFIPEDRHKDGLVLEYSIADNLILGLHKNKEFSRNDFWIKQAAIEKNANEKRETFDIRSANTSVTAGTLSGGNQQKIVIARELGNNPDIILSVQPTRGLDVGAIEFVQNNLMQQRCNGKGIFLFSLELDEILAVSDRIAVMYRGEIIDIVDADTISRQELGLLMLGGKNKEVV